MAHLNLRDRMIETTIAYVGAEDKVSLAFSHVQRAVQRGRAGTIKETPQGGGRVLTLDWKPREEMRLNDCELTVKLVSAEAVEDRTMQSILVDADGLVLVVDADPAAHDRNRRAVRVVRDAIAHASERKLPVVVQVHAEELDGPGVRELALPDWPRVKASASTGDGLMETLQRAVGVVVESMQNSSSAEAAARPVGSPRVEGNPLLAALRLLVQTTIADQLAAFEARRGAAGLTADVREPLVALVASCAALGAQIDVMASTIKAIRDDVARHGEALRAPCPPVPDPRIGELSEQVAALLDETRRRRGWPF